MSTLPSTWIETNLGAVVPYGSTVKAEPEELSPETWVLELEDIEKDSTKVRQRLTFADRQSKSTKNRFEAGDVLYGKLRPYLNKVIFADQPGVCTTEIMPIKTTEAVNGRYLFHWLRHPRFLAYVTDVSHGVNMPRLGTEAGRQAPFVLAPKNEQKRIADKLDTVLSRVDAVNARLARVGPILKRFRQSVLAAATSGTLTEDWRGANQSQPGVELLEALLSDHEAAGGKARGNASEPTKEAHDLTAEDVPEDWGIGTLGDCCTPGRPITYGILKPGPELNVGIPYIRVADFPGNRLNLNGIRKTSPDIDLQYKRSRLLPGDLLLSIRGSVGRLIEIPPELENANITQDTARLSISSRLNSRFIYYSLLSPDALRRMGNAIRGVAVRGINIGDVRALQVPIPSAQEQAEIVRRVDTLFAFADRIEARLQTAQVATERLTPSLLAKAFRGELVPQDPNDEPASELLRRLAQTSPAGTSRGRRKAVATT